MRQSEASFSHPHAPAWGTHIGNYQEPAYLRVSAVLRDIKKKIPIDLIVHTKPMHEKFIELGSQFSKEVLAKGKILYEKKSLKSG